VSIVAASVRAAGFRTQRFDLKELILPPTVRLDLEIWHRAFEFRAIFQSVPPSETGDGGGRTSTDSRLNTGVLMIGRSVRTAGAISISNALLAHHMTRDHMLLTADSFWAGFAKNPIEFAYDIDRDRSWPSLAAIMWCRMRHSSMKDVLEACGWRIPRHPVIMKTLVPLQLHYATCISAMKITYL
jgi:hypothetical protein